MPILYIRTKWNKNNEVYIGVWREMQRCLEIAFNGMNNSIHKLKNNWFCSNPFCNRCIANEQIDEQQWPMHFYIDGIKIIHRVIGQGREAISSRNLGKSYFFQRNETWLLRIIYRISWQRVCRNWTKTDQRSEIMVCDTNHNYTSNNIICKIPTYYWSKFQNWT